MNRPSSSRRSRVVRESSSDYTSSESDSESDPRPSRKGKGVKRKVGKASANFNKNRDRMNDGLEKVPTRLQTQLANIPDRAAQINEKGMTFIRANQPPKSMDDLLQMLPVPVIDNIWTQDEEDKFTASFATDPYRRYIESDAAFPIASNFMYWTMWKIIPRLRDCFPTDIIGAKVHLIYDTEVDIGGGVMKPDPRWSSNFCVSLTNLVLGSPCGANMKLLALIIRYAVADRIDDRRRVPLDDHCTGNRFFDDLNSRVNSENDNRPLRDLHADLRKDWRGVGRFLPWASDVMCAIETLNASVRSDQPTRSAPDEVFPEYGVMTADLTRVIRAMDTVGDLGYANLGSVEQRAAFVAQARTRQDPLQSKNKGEFNALRVRLLEHEERFRARRILSSQQEQDDPQSHAGSSGQDRQHSNGGHNPRDELHNDGFGDDGFDGDEFDDEFGDNGPNNYDNDPDSDHPDSDHRSDPPHKRPPVYPVSGILMPPATTQAPQASCEFKIIPLEESTSGTRAKASRAEPLNLSETALSMRKTKVGDDDLKKALEWNVTDVFQRLA
ncbi:hypothetical protein F5Y14DRAFT_306137 [Nemania sp. NC0429]|nr:hypothetical protein F5Y14DRAFT_306137 [Nemania sp. NC0429]